MQQTTWIEILIAYETQVVVVQPHGKRLTKGRLKGKAPKMQLRYKLPMIKHTMRMLGKESRHEASQRAFKAGAGGVHIYHSLGIRGQQAAIRMRPKEALGKGNLQHIQRALLQQK